MKVLSITAPMASRGARSDRRARGRLGHSLARLTGLLPTGRMLPAQAWAARHRAIVVVLWLHVAGLAAFGVLTGNGAAHVALDAGAVALAAGLAGWARLGRRAREAVGSLGLVTCSAMLVHLWGGVIEAHFHFFVVVALLALYQSWLPFLLGLVYVVAHHGLMGTIAPELVYNHPAAIAAPWKWAMIHGAFVLAASAASVTAWRLNERLLEEIGRSDERSASVLEAAGEGIYTLDRDGRVTSVNAAATRILGYPAAELLGREPHALIHTAAEGGAYPAADCAVCVSCREGLPRSVSDELYRRRDGSSFPVEYTAAAITEDGEPVGTVVVFHDITERRAVERMKDEFVSVVSHELRTPLASIRGSLGLLAGGALGPLPERGQRMMDIAVCNSDRLVRLINDILDVQRINGGRIAMEHQDVDAQALLETAAEAMEGMAVQAGVELRTEPVDARARVDPDRITQTLSNLLSNAIKFSPRGGRVTLACDHSDDDLVFSVADQGRGIPADQLDAVFEPFCQVDSSDEREKGGTGLGLAICRSIVDQHGGRLWVDSAVGRGTTFRFTVPVAAVAPVAPAPSGVA